MAKKCKNKHEKKREVFINYWIKVNSPKFYSWKSVSPKLIQNNNQMLFASKRKSHWMIISEGWIIAYIGNKNRKNKN